MNQLTAAFETAIARAPQANLEWVRRHFIHHNGASYFVIPNLYSVDQKKDGEELRALAMNQLAGVFDDLKLVKALSPWELKRFGREESRNSYTDLTPFRNDSDEAAALPAQTKNWWWALFGWGATSDAGKGMRNHGLLSKAQRALDIAEWSPAAQRDVEIFKLVDTEGLTPLLSLLNDATLKRRGVPIGTPGTGDKPAETATAGDTTSGFPAKG